jgi:hypothetical protein
MGITALAKTATMVTVTISSIKVNPLLGVFMVSNYASGFMA